MTGHVGHNTNHLFIPRVSTNFGKDPLLLWVCSVEQSTINCCGGYFSFIFQKILSASILAKYYFFVLPLCVCMYIFGVISIVVYVFCTLLLLHTGLH